MITAGETYTGGARQERRLVTSIHGDRVYWTSPDGHSDDCLLSSFQEWVKHSGAHDVRRARHRKAHLQDIEIARLRALLLYHGIDYRDEP